MIHVDAITNTYKQHNEDAFGFGSNFAWVIDGALPLNQTNVTPWSNDVAWVVHWWSTYLNSHLSDDTKTIHTLLKEGVAKLNNTFSNFVSISQLSKLDRASCCIGISRISESFLECYVLGDIEIAIKFKDGHFEVITDTSIATLDDEVIQLIAHTKGRDKAIVFNGYTKEELIILRKNRMKMNAHDGYAILEHEPTAIDHGIYKKINLEAVESVLLMSDGYSAIYNKYDHYTLANLFDTVSSNGADDIIHTLRKKELEDFTTCQRLRRHDDATGVYFQSPML